MLFITRIILILAATVFISFAAKSQSNEENPMINDQYQKATFGSGCFWCSEAIFSRVKGVIEAVSGYSGGTEPKPDYKLISTGTTNYAEVVQITYNPEIVSFNQLLKIFWSTHDPTTLNRQGADVGPQYRSVIFYHDNTQKQETEDVKEKLEKENIWKNPIVTEIAPFTNFYKAETFHQDFYENNPSYGYCNFVITPKIKKFEKVFKDLLKE